MTSDRREPHALRGLRPTALPASLRERVLDAAAAALASGPTESAWERLWRSRAARLAWAGTVAGLSACHLALSLLGPARGGAPAGVDVARGAPSRSASPSPSRESMRDVLSLPPLDPGALDRAAGLIGRAAAAEDATDEPAPTRPGVPS